MSTGGDLYSARVPRSRAPTENRGPGSGGTQTPIGVVRRSPQGRSARRRRKSLNGKSPRGDESSPRGDCGCYVRRCRLSGIGTEVRDAEARAAWTGVGTAARHIGTRAVGSGIRTRAGNHGACAVGARLGTRAGNHGARAVGTRLGPCTGNGRGRPVGSSSGIRTRCSSTRAVRSGGGAGRGALDTTRRRWIGTGERSEGDGRRASAGEEDLCNELLSHGRWVPPVNPLETSEFM
jgi:hypothetical protein